MISPLIRVREVCGYPERKRALLVGKAQRIDEEINSIRMVNKLLAFRKLWKRFDSIMKVFFRVPCRYQRFGAVSTDTSCFGIFAEEQNSCDCADTRRGIAAEN